MGKSLSSLLASLTSSGPAALMKDTWVFVISECGHIILEKASFTKVADKEGQSGSEKVVRDFHWEQFTKNKRYKPVKRDDWKWKRGSLDSISTLCIK